MSSIDTERYFDFDDEHPDFESLCDNCQEPSDDLEYIESGDPSVGYREGQWLCPKCRPKERPQRRYR